LPRPKLTPWSHLESTGITAPGGHIRLAPKIVKPPEGERVGDPPGDFRSKSPRLGREGQDRATLGSTAQQGLGVNLL